MFNKILVAIDLEPEGAHAVLQKAASLSGDTGEMWVIHSVEPQFVQYSIDPTFTGALTHAMEADAIKAARKRMSEICSDAGIAEDRQIVLIGRAVERIHEVAVDLGVDLIVIGSQARRGLARLLGSTANAVLRNSPVNVMTVRLSS